MSERGRMLDTIREKYKLKSPLTLSAMSGVSREKFAPEKYKSSAYKDAPIPIGFGQTMSQPFTVAFMTHLLLGNKRQTMGGKLRNKKVLEIGTGSGYQAAVLSRIFGQVYSVEIIKELAQKAKETLKKLKYENVHVKKASGQWGWKTHSPYDAVLVTAGVEEKVPQELFDQLKVGGVLVAPVGEGYDKLMTKFTKLKNGKIKKKKFGVFHFVPFVEEKAVKVL